MPTGAGGLPDVTQKIGVDAREGVAGYESLRKAAWEVNGANDMLNKSYVELTSRMRDMSAAAGRGIFQGELDSVKEYITQLAQVQNMYGNLAEASKRQIQVQQQQARAGAALFTDMAKQQKAAYSDMYAQAIADNKAYNVQQKSAIAEQKAAYSNLYAQAIADNKQFNADQMAAARAAATQQKLMQMDALAENRRFNAEQKAAADQLRAQQNAAYSQLQANAISENRIMNQRIAAEKALQAEIEKTGEILDKRVTSGSNIVPSVIAGQTARDIGIDKAANASRYADDILMQRLIAGQAQAANAAEIYSTSRVSDVANAFADAAAARLFSRGGGNGIPVVPVSSGGGGGYGAYDPNAVVGRATSDAINAIRDSNKTYSMDPLMIAGAVSAAAAILASPGARSAIGDAAVTAAVTIGAAGAAAGRAVSDTARGVGVLGAAAAGGLLGGGAALGGLISGGGSFDAGTAGKHGAVVTNFLGKWLPRIHYALMATNEILATAGPATIAAGAAAAVGLEGAQTAYGRLSAVNTVGQSLGTGLGITPGQFLGLGDSLQNAQTRADPAVWELLGAAKNIVNAPGNTGTFNQLGTNTLDMIDRFASKVTAAFTGGTAGKQLSDIVSQGTTDLQQFGDVLGNIGTTFLHVAPALPGVGGDLLSTLQGATRLLSNATGAIPTNVLALGLAAEAGGRYGPALVGTAGNLLGRAPGGIFGTTARLATADDIALGAAAPLAVSGLPAAEVGETIAGTGAAGALGGVGALPIAAAAALAFGAGKIITSQSPTQQWIGGLQSQANQDDFTQAFGQLSTNMGLFGGMTGGPQTMGTEQGMGYGIEQSFGLGQPFNLYQGAKNTWQSLLHGLFGAPAVRTPAGQASAALQDSASQLNDLLAAGPAIQGILGGGSLQNAYDMADMAGLQGSQLQQLISGTAAQKADIKAQLLNEQAGYKMMGSSPGVYGANVDAVQAVSGLAATKLSTVNQSWDQIVSNATGGTASATGFAAGIGVISALGKTPGVAQALTSFSSPASQQAWAAFSSPSTTNPGALQQAQSMADWMRTAMTVSQGIGQGQYNEVTAYQAKQLLPYAKSSPAALAQLGVLSQEMGGPGYNPLETQKQNYAAISKAIDSAAGSAKQYNKNINDATIATAGVSQQALNFGATLKANTYAALSGGASSLPQVATDRENFLKAFLGNGKVNQSALAPAANNLAKDFASAMINSKDAGAIIPQMLAGKGLSSAQISSITTQVQRDLVKVSASITETPAQKAIASHIGPAGTVNTSAVKALQSQATALFGTKALSLDVTAKAHAEGLATLKSQLASLTSRTIDETVHASGQSQIATLNAAIQALSSKTVVAAAKAEGAGAVAALNAAIQGLRDKTITVTTNFITTGHMPGVSAPGQLGVGVRTGQTGMFLPGYGGGDIVPAMLEPGELVVPKHMVGALRPFLSGKIPGFAGGGWVPYPTYEANLPAYNAYKAQMVAQHKWYDSFDQWYAGIQSAVKKGTTAAIKSTASGGDFLTSVSGAIANDTSAGGQKIATSLINKIGTAMTYAKSVSASAISGLNLANMTVGIDGGGGAAPPGAPGYNAAAWNNAVANYANNAAPTPSVQDNMKTYLSTVQSFTKDLHTATTQGLNKSLLSQIISAGPTQGDSLLQSIMGSTGGTKLANSLFGQITKASNALGAQAGESMNPGVKIAANLTSASASTVLKGLDGKKVTVTVEAKGVAAIKSAIDSLSNKTITITEIIKTVGGQIAAKGHAAGGLIYGSGYGDTVPAWLSPGEAVIPADLVPYFAPMLGAYGVPGFSGGHRGGDARGWDWWGSQGGWQGGRNSYMAQAANAASAAGSGGGPGGASGSFVGAPGPGDYATYDPGANIMVWHSGGMSASPDTTPWQMSQNRGSNHSFDFHFHGGGHDLSPSQIRQVVQHVEAKLLSNAKNNRSSGLTLSGYGT